MNRHFFKALLFFALHLISLQTNAQRIYFSDTTNNWISSRGGEMGPGGMSTWSYCQYFASDTLVESNGYIYTEIKPGIGWGGQYFARALVRDDTAAGLVYIKPQNHQNGFYRATDTNEFVYMNYNLNIGDTLIMPLVLGGRSDSISMHIVQQKDSFLVGTTWYRQLELYAYKGMSGGGTSNYTRYTIYEGVGPGSGPILEPSTLNEYGPPNLSCFRNQGTIHPKFGYSCDPLALRKVVERQQNFQYYPNPTSDQLRIKDPELLGSLYAVSITNLHGSILQHVSFRNEITLELEQLPVGLYFLHFFNGTLLLQSEKLLIDR